MQFTWLRKAKQKIYPWKQFPDRPSSVDQFSPFEENIFIQFSIVGESYDIGSDGKPNKFTQIFTYPVDLVTSAVDPNISQIGEVWELGIKEFNENLSIPSNVVYYYEGPVYINAELSMEPSIDVDPPTEITEIYSLKGFILEPGAKISPNIKLITGLPITSKRSHPLQTFSEVDNFCNDPAQYKASIFTTMAKTRKKEEYLDRQMSEANSNINNLIQSNINLYPNPAKESCIVEFGSTLSDITITLTDLNGKESLIQKIEEPNNKAEINVSILLSGVYIVSVMSSDKVIGRARLVKL